MLSWMEILFDTLLVGHELNQNSEDDRRKRDKTGTYALALVVFVAAFVFVLLI